MAAVDDSVLPVHDSKSEPPRLFDGTTRLYISLTCPYAQRVWIARNYKGLQDIQIVPIDLQNRPAWYKEKVYPPNKVPSLEHDGKVIGESLDLLDYLEDHFGGPQLKPTDPVKEEAAEELLKYVDTFTKVGWSALAKEESDVVQEVGPALDYLENALSKFNAEGPFFLGQFSLVDIAYAPFIERFQIAFSKLKNYDITFSRPKLSKWIEVKKINLISLLITKEEYKVLVEAAKKALWIKSFLEEGQLSFDLLGNRIARPRFHFIAYRPTRVSLEEF